MIERKRQRWEGISEGTKRSEDKIQSNGLSYLSVIYIYMYTQIQIHILILRYLYIELN